MEKFDKDTTKESEEKSFSIKDYLNSCLKAWKWFLLSIIIITGLGVAYVYMQQPRYTRTMSVLVKDNDPAGGAFGALSGALSTFGFGGANTNVNNEIIAFTSPAVMNEVVDRLDLTMSYVLRRFPHGVTLYGNTLPFKATFLDMPVQQGAKFRIDWNPDGSMKLYKFRVYKDDDVIKYDNEINVPKGATIVKTPAGRIEFTANPEFTGLPFPGTQTIQVSRSGKQSTIERFSRELTAKLADREAQVIDLTVTDVNTQRAVDILNTLLDVYTESWVDDKNKISIATSEFIDERLALLQKELGEVDTEIADFKAKNRIPDPEEAARASVKQNAEIEQKMLDVNNQLGMAQYVKDYVSNPANRNKVIPSNTGIASAGIEEQISKYNTLLLTRNNLAQSSSASNPLVRDYDEQLQGLRESIERGINNQVVALSKAAAGFRAAKGETDAQLESGPGQAKYLLSVTRQQEVKAQLYLYLLQQREENQLNQQFTADKTRVITPPMGPIKPVSPKKGMLISLAFILSILFPAGIIYLRESMNTTVRSRKDLEQMAVPYLGEIPQMGRSQNLRKLRNKLLHKAKKSELETMPVVVSAGARNLMNESFRIVRGNIDFMRGGMKNKVIMVTSINPGSGKSFVTFNLAASFALKGKRVLIIDCDLRHGSSSQYVGMPSKGLCSYISGSAPDWHRLVVPVADHPGLDVLPIGHRPPNPAELLESPRVKTLLDEAEAEYDYIFLDCPPVDVVVDTQLLADYADKTIFVVRAGLLEKASVPEIDEIYKSNRFSQMSILLNGTEGSHSKFNADDNGYYGNAFE